MYFKREKEKRENVYCFYFKINYYILARGLKWESRKIPRGDLCFKNVVKCN